MRWAEGWFLETLRFAVETGRLIWCRREHSGGISERLIFRGGAKEQGVRTCRRPRRWGSLTQWAVDAKRLSCVYAYDIGSRVGVQRTLFGLRFHWLAAFKLLACKWRREKLVISAPAIGSWRLAISRARLEARHL